MYLSQTILVEVCLNHPIRDIIESACLVAILTVLAATMTPLSQHFRCKYLYVCSFSHIASIRLHPYRYDRRNGMVCIGLYFHSSFP